MRCWITGRLPTAADAEPIDEQVKTKSRPDQSPEDGGAWVHYSTIVPGQPWWSYKAERAAGPTPTPTTAPARAVTAMAATQYRVFAACSDGTMWDWTHAERKWTQISAIPQPEATND